MTLDPDMPEWLQNEAIVLFEYFDIHPLGVEVCPGIIPPQKAWEALVLYLASKGDELAWQVGATVNRYPKKYHADVCGWFATLLNLSHWTIQQYAYIERNVFPEARTSRLSIWIHRPLAKIKDLNTQIDYITTAASSGWNLSQFEKWLETRGIEPEEMQYQSDRDFENEQRQYRTETDNADLRTENENLRQRITELESTPKLEPIERVLARLDSILNLSPTEAATNIIKIFNELKAIVAELRSLL